MRSNLLLLTLCLSFCKTAFIRILKSFFALLFLFQFVMATFGCKMSAFGTLYTLMTTKSESKETVAGIPARKVKGLISESAEWDPGNSGL